MIRKIFTLGLFLCLFYNLSVAQSHNHLSLDEAITLTLERNNQLQAVDVSEKAVDAAIKQAKVKPNPELEIGLEQFGKNEIEVGVAQTIELGGKRSARTAIASQDAANLKLERQLLEQELTAEATHLFLAILAIQNQLALIDESIEINESTLEIIQDRITAGAAMRIDKVRIELELAELQLEKTNLLDEHSRYMNIFKETWGMADFSYPGVSGNIVTDISLPDLTELEAKLSDHPEVLLINEAQKSIRLEINQLQAEAIPDLTISAGYARNNEEKANAILLGASMELPVFNKNRDAISEKNFQSKAIDFEIENLQIKLKKELSEKYLEFASLSEQLTTLQDNILPKAEMIYDELQQFYGFGKISYLAVLESQSELIQIKMQIIETRAGLAEIAADIQLITGIKINIIE